MTRAQYRRIRSRARRSARPWPPVGVVWIVSVLLSVVCWALLVRALLWALS